MKKLKAEYQPGGSKRQEILSKAVKFILDPKFGTQNMKHAFLLEEILRLVKKDMERMKKLNEEN